MIQSNYIISIDLGTTNCAVAYATREQLTSLKPQIHFFDISQLIEKAEISEKPLLPSFLYLPGDYEVSKESYILPWNKEPEFIVGEYAKKMGRFIPGRLVSSAKSWLCHGGVDRNEKILPWAGSEEVRKVSPVEASSRYLAHIRDAWNFRIARGNNDKILEKQDVIITVPASFNDVARNLTVKAAYMAGFQHITLLEEPQSAFYSWLTSYEASLKRYLGNTNLILICDVGGGTTDFSLIRVEKIEGEIFLKRVAVGEHILLGGDNIDIAIARFMENKFKEKKIRLDTKQWAILCQECQEAKERMLGDENLFNISITIPGTGSRLIGGMLKENLSRDELLKIVIDGFTPFIDMENLKESHKCGIQEWGLPYTTNPAITAHLASFLKSHVKECPDAVLFNGGTLKPDIIRNRIIDVLNSWLKSKKGIKVLPCINLDLAVARGGVYYGLVRLGRGVKITGGTPRSYYIGIDTGSLEKDKQSALCLIPRGLDEGQEIVIGDREFNLLVDEPISFPLYCSTTRYYDMAGKIFDVKDCILSPLSPLYTVLNSVEGKNEIPVNLRARVSEVGVLELSCVTPDDKNNWKLDFNLRQQKSDDKYQKENKKNITSEFVGKSSGLIYDAFSIKPGKIKADNLRPKNLFHNIEILLALKRDKWDTGLIRKFWETLKEVKDKRKSSPEHERFWLNMSGFCLRPGFGYPLDDWRINELWEIFPKWLQHNRETSVRIEWWILWRRVTGGLNKSLQQEIFDKISPYFLPGKKTLKPFSGPPPGSNERLEIMRLAVSLEELEPQVKLELGNMILGRFKKEAGFKNSLWLLARLGSRIPFSSGVHNVLSGDIISGWVEEILKMEWNDRDAVSFCLSNIARYTGDRKRDIDFVMRDVILKKMRKEKSSEPYILPIETIIEVKSEDKTMLFGEALPIGLRLFDNMLTKL